MRSTWNFVFAAMMVGSLAGCGKGRQPGAPAGGGQAPATAASPVAAPTYGPLTGPRPTPPGSPAAAVIYVCPMHPEVTSDKPGKCPQCGMVLVVKK
ncbi:hypothetical protein LLG95_07770 [bacterium]|nr:hypothetical protein [bacterium]